MTIQSNYDVIIIGARVAGASLAYECSKRGYKVLLVDRSSFPSDILSTHNFFNNSVSMLKDMGVWDKLLQTDTPLYKRAYIQFDDVVIDGMYPEVDGEANCFCVRRTHLDHILFENACAQEGVTAIEGFRVNDVILDDEGTVIGIVGINRHGKTERYSAKLVVGADGRNSTLRGLVQSEKKLSVPTDFASYVGYFEGFQQEGDPCVEFYKIDDKLAIVFPTSDQLCVIGVMFPLADKEWIDRFKSNPETGFRDLVSEGLSQTTLPTRLVSAKLVGSVKGLLGYVNDWYQGMGKGWALVGDALSFKDPAVGQGMHDAIYGARLLTEIVAKESVWNDKWEEMAKSYQTATEAKMLSRFYLACQFTKNVPFTEEQTAINRLIGSNPKAIETFLGIYNYASEPEQLEQTLMQLMRG
jgi:flavin-dependent dehydrogenase